MAKINKLLTLIPKQFVRNITVGRPEPTVCWPRPDYGPMEVQRSELMNGIRVAAARPQGSYIGACTIMFQAGSRFELDDQLGASHFIRAAASGTGCGYSAFAKMRYLQQMGATLTCSADRQTVAYTLRCPVPLFSELKCYLLDAAVRCQYHQWELDDRKSLIKDDLVRLTPEQRVMDLLQQAAWTGPLANSLYCIEERISGMSENSIACFAKTHFRTDGCTIASVGVPFEETIKLAEWIEPSRERPCPRCQPPSCARGGFESYDLGRCSDTWIAVAVPGCGTCDFATLVKNSIIAAACGTGNVAMGHHHMDRTPQAPIGCMAGLDYCTDYKAFNISYYETGLFGVLAKTRAATAWPVAMAAAEFLAHVGELTCDQIEVGKKRLKLSMTFNDENCVQYTEGMALQLANNVKMDASKSALSVIESIQSNDLVCAAKKLSTMYPCMSVAVVGDVGAVPTDRDLVCGL